MLGFTLLALAATALAAPQSLFSRQSANLPSNLSWTSSGILVTPKKDSRNIAGIKDPSIVFYNNA
jgi:integral membrane sensor domain MASE1